MTGKKSKGDRARPSGRRAPFNWIPWTIVAAIILVAAGLAVYVGQQANRIADATPAPTDFPAVGLPSAVTAAEAFTMYQGNAVILDVRDPKDWNQYHITNSKSIPLAELSNRLNELPRHTPIVVVDDNFDLSPKGRDVLLNAGFPSVTALTGGIADWVLSNYPFEGDFPY